MSVKVSDASDEMSPARGTRRGALRSAVSWSYALTIGKMVITTGLSLYLAAVLGPRAFGLIAMALVFTSFIEMLQQQGLMPAIITRRELRDDHTDTAFLLVMGVGLVCTLAGLAVAPLWAGLNDLPELAPVIQVLALGIPVTSSVVVHEALLRRRLEFKKLALRTWISVLAGGVAGVFAAFSGWGVWALVTQQVVMNASIAVVLWIVTPWRPHLRFRGEAAVELWRYSIRSSGGSLGLFLGRRLDIIVAGALFGPVVVGLYRMGQSVATMVVNVTARSMQSVSLPGLSGMQDDTGAFVERLLAMQRFTSSLALPALGVLAGVAPVVERLLGAEWSGVTIAVQIMAASQGLAVLSLLFGPALQALGRPGTLAIIVWIWSAMMAGALFAASKAGREGHTELVALCLSIAIVSGLSSALSVIVSGRVLGVRIRILLTVALPGLSAAAAATGASYGVAQLASSLNPVLQLACAGSAGLMAAASLLMLVEPGARALIRAGYGRLRRRTRAEHTTQQRMLVERGRAIVDGDGS